MLGDEVRHRRAHGIVVRLVRQLVDGGEGGVLVGHEIGEPHVDRLIGRQHVTVAQAAVEQVFGAAQPVPAQGVRVGMSRSHPGGVGDHGCHRPGHVDRITMCDNEGRVGEGGVQGGELFEMLG